jgi:hypothetical protein
MTWSLGEVFSFLYQGVVINAGIGVRMRLSEFIVRGMMEILEQWDVFAAAERAPEIYELAGPKSVESLCP